MYHLVRLAVFNDHEFIEANYSYKLCGFYDKCGRIVVAVMTVCGEGVMIKFAYIIHTMSRKNTQNKMVHSHSQS